MTASEERAVAIPTDDGIVLDARFVPAHDGSGPGAVVAPPHPLYGGSMESPVVNEVAHACTKNEIASLRFDWRGMGGSGGERSGEAADADRDYAAALQQMAESVPGALVACGYSFGAGAAMRAALREARVRRVVMVAPPPAFLDAESLQSFGGSLLVVAGEEDNLAPPGELEKLLAPCSDAQLVRIPDTDHFFMVGLAELGRAVSEFLSN